MNTATRLIEAVCPECKTYLGVEVPAGAEVLCRNCGRWVEVKEPEPNEPTHKGERGGYQRLD